MNLTIRPAIDSDIPAIAAIYGDHVIHGLASFEYKAPSEDEMRKRYQAIIKNGYPYLVACEDETVIGYCYAAGFHSRKAYEKTVENTIYLKPSAHGKGIGKKLLKALIEECSKRGFHEMIAVITKLDPPVSIILHKRIGFHHVGTLSKVGYKHDQWLDVVYMQKTLKPVL